MKITFTFFRPLCSLDRWSGGVWSVLVRYDVTSSPFEVHISIVPEIIEVLKEGGSSINKNQPVCSEEGKVGNMLRLLTLKGGVDQSGSRCCALPSLQNLLSGFFLPGRLWGNYVLTKRCFQTNISSRPSFLSFPPPPPCWPQHGMEGGSSKGAGCVGVDTISCVLQPPLKPLYRSAAAQVAQAEVRHTSLLTCTVSAVSTTVGCCSSSAIPTVP